MDFKFKKIINISYLSVIALTLSSCATLNQKENAEGQSPAAVPSEMGSHGAFASTPVVKGVADSADYHFSMAQAYLAEGRTDLAIEEFKLTLVYDPKSALVHTRLAAEYVKKGLLSAAMESLKTALQVNPKFIEARMLMAGLYSATQNSAQSLVEYETVLKQDANNEEAVVFYAQTLIELGKLNTAVKALQGFLKKNPESVAGWYALARSEQQSEHDEAAVGAFKKALELRPHFSQASIALGYLYEEKGKNKEAIEIYRVAFDSNQDLAAANRLATIYLKEGRYSEAVPILEAIQGLDAEDLNSRVKLGLVYIELKKLPEAIQVFQKIISKNPDSDRVPFYLGSAYEEAGKVDEAIDSYKKVASTSKLFSDAVLHASNLMKQKGNVQEAKDWVKNALIKDKKQLNLYLYLATLEDESKELPPAIHALEQAIAIFPDDERSRYYLGSLYDRMGDSDGGIKQMEEILKRNPDHVDALNYLGYTWTLKGIRFSDAEMALKRAMKLSPKNGYVTDSWGWFLFTRGKLGEAVKTLERATLQKPNESTILEHLADVYSQMNLKDKALQIYKDAYRFAEDETLREKVKKKIDGIKYQYAKDDQGTDQKLRSPAQSDSP